ncbi:MAG: hypothetical protein K2I44_02015, partial [Muribaculaceae bacterium]|nr:hypothetical protein [Muribaculaceae bacterium]
MHRKNFNKIWTPVKFISKYGIGGHDIWRERNLSLNLQTRARLLLTIMKLKKYLFSGALLAFAANAGMAQIM